MENYPDQFEVQFAYKKNKHYISPRQEIKIIFNCINNNLASNFTIRHNLKTASMCLSLVILPESQRQLIEQTSHKKEIVKCPLSYLC
jgi:hypothetical protein